MENVGGCRGMVWGLSKIAVLLGAVMFFTVLWSFHSAFDGINSHDSVVQESHNIAFIIDSVGSSPSYCEVTYETPETLSSRFYSIVFNPGNVSISLDDGVNHHVSFLSNVDGNLSLVGGGFLRIIKRNETVEVV